MWACESNLCLLVRRLACSVHRFGQRLEQPGAAQAGGRDVPRGWRRSQCGHRPQADAAQAHPQEEGGHSRGDASRPAVWRRGLGHAKLPLQGGQRCFFCNVFLRNFSLQSRWAWRQVAWLFYSLFSITIGKLKIYMYDSLFCSLKKCLLFYLL